MVRRALKECAPGLGKVKKIEEFPVLPHDDRFDDGEVPTARQLRGYRVVDTNTLAFYDDGLATLVLFDSPLLKDIDCERIMDFARDLRPIMPNLTRYNKKQSVFLFIGFFTVITN
jgi:hypothetical protein